MERPAERHGVDIHHAVNAERDDGIDDEDAGLKYGLRSSRMAGGGVEGVNGRPVKIRLIVRAGAKYRAAVGEAGNRCGRRSRGGNETFRHRGIFCTVLWLPCFPILELWRSLLLFWRWRLRW